jgi:hypothetical protein
MTEPQSSRSADPHASPTGATQPDGEVFRCGTCEAEYYESDACPLCGTLRVDAACESHPDRAAEGRCVLCARRLCGDCRAGEHHAFLCADHRTVPVIEGWAQVYTTTTDVEAQLLCDNLRAEGIDARVFSQKDRAFSVDLGELSIVRVLVPVWEYEVTLAVIRNRMAPHGEIVFACPACGQVSEAGQEQCTECGSALR